MGSVGDLQGANLSATVSESDTRGRMGGGLPADQYDQGKLLGLGSFTKISLFMMISAFSSDFYWKSCIFNIFYVK